jgi:hypothetical protein
MNRSRTVTSAFRAKKHAKEPAEHVEFEPDEKVVYWKHPDGEDGKADDRYVIFGREDDRKRTDPFLVDAATFDANTEGRD